MTTIARAKRSSHANGGAIPPSAAIAATLWHWSLVLNAVLLVAVVYAFAFLPTNSPATASWSQPLTLQEIHFGVGHPKHPEVRDCVYERHLSSSSSACTPSMSVDMVILSGTDHALVVRRKDNNMLAVMGGYVKVGETLDEAVRRELWEEMTITLKDSILLEHPMLFGFYSDAQRDNRRHSVAAAFAVQLDGHELPVAADDAKQVERIPLAEIEDHSFFVDHRTMLLDFRERLRANAMDVTAAAAASAGDTRSGIEGGFPANIFRTLCGETLWDGLEVEPLQETIR